MTDRDRRRSWLRSDVDTAEVVSHYTDAGGMVMTFDYENNRWAGGNNLQARLWYEQLERQPPFSVRNRLCWSSARWPDAIMIGTVSMPRGFAQDWLTHLEERVKAQQSLLSRIFARVRATFWLPFAPASCERD